MQTRRRRFACPLFVLLPVAFPGSVWWGWLPLWDEFETIAVGDVAVQV